MCYILGPFKGAIAGQQSKTVTNELTLSSVSFQVLYSGNRRVILVALCLLGENDSSIR